MLKMTNTPKGIKIIYDYQLCEEIISQNKNEKNECIIVNENFFKIMNMKIPEKNDRAVELKYYKPVLKIQMTFPISHKTVFIVEKSKKRFVSRKGTICCCKTNCR